MKCEECKLYRKWEKVIVKQLSMSLRFHNQKLLAKQHKNLSLIESTKQIKIHDFAQALFFSPICTVVGWLSLDNLPHFFLIWWTYELGLRTSCICFNLYLIWLRHWMLTRTIFFRNFSQPVYSWNFMRMNGHYTDNHGHLKLNPETLWFTDELLHVIS